MRIRKLAFSALAATALSACVTTQPSAVASASGDMAANQAYCEQLDDQYARMRESCPVMGAAQLEAAIAAASEHPLGSARNPIRAQAPQGQRAYLDRLRCADNSAPRYARIGNLGAGVYGTIVDEYRVTCPGSAAVTVVMDMYHRGHVEMKAVPGFTIVN